MSTVWVFGSTGSIGKVLCEALLDRGDNVISFTSSKNSNLSLHFELQTNPRISFQEFDLSNLDDLDCLISLSEDPECTPTHVIFLARGRVPLDSILDDAAWGEIAIHDIMISMMVPMRIGMKLASKPDSDLKTITFVSSQYAIVAQDPKLYADPNSQISSIYSATRGGIISGARALGVFAGKNGIRVNSLILGGVEETTKDDLKIAIESRLPTKKMLTADNACDWLLFLASEKSVGAISSPIIVDNGWTSI